MPVKITIFYHENIAGFSESWVDNDNGVINYPNEKIAAYLKGRLLLCGQNTEWDYVRINDLDPTFKRRVKVIVAGDPIMKEFEVPTAGSYRQGRADKREASDFGGTRLLVRKLSSDLYQARFFLGGFPDNQVDGGGLYQATGLFPQNFVNFQTILKTLKFGWNSYTTPIAGQTAALTSMLTGIDGTCLITVTPIGANPPPFLGDIVVGSRIVVRIANQVMPKNANGTFTVLVLSPTTCRTVKPLSITNFTAGAGQLSIKKTKQFKQVNTLEVIRVVKRGPGRPFGLYRGKQAVQPRG